jgi:hypothetical protein
MKNVSKRKLLKLFWQTELSTPHDLNNLLLLVGFFGLALMTLVSCQDNRFQVELDIFSGRPNPTWYLSQSETKTLKKMLGSLSITPSVKMPDNLGYRGFMIKQGEPPSTRQPVYKIYHDVVQQSAAGVESYYNDPERQIERWLLLTAREHIEAGLYQMIQSEIEDNGNPF